MRRRERQADPTRLSERARLALSFACAFAGWAAGFAAYVAWGAHASGWSSVPDLESVRGWSAGFTFVAWGLAVAPLARREGDRRGVARWPAAPFFGAAAGLAALALLLLPFGAIPLAIEPPFLLHATVTGGVTWGAFTALVDPLGRAAGRCSGRTAAVLFALPLALTWVFWLGAWPAVERWAPAVAYRYGDYETRTRLFERTLRALRVGDSLEDLRRALPGEFAVEPRNAVGTLASGEVYRIDFAGGRATKVEIGG